MDKHDVDRQFDSRILLTPGPLCTTATVKRATLVDIGSRDIEFIELLTDIRERLLALSSADDSYTVTLMQGSGTFAVESVISSTIASDGKALIIENGVYGRRMAAMAAVYGIPHTVLSCAEDQAPPLDDIEQTLAQDPAISCVLAVHCETTTGILNPIREIGVLAYRHHATYVVDAMSSFGAYDIDLDACHIDHLISSANKCIQGIPGFGFVISRREALSRTEGSARTISLDLHAQWKYCAEHGLFRFTPPTHVLLAFRQALIELHAEGGIAKRAARYRANHRLLVRGMRALGYRAIVDTPLQSYIITAFHYPNTDQFDFSRFYTRLRGRGYVIYPGRLSNIDSFRIGTIGDINVQDIQGFLDAVDARCA